MAYLGPGFQINSDGDTADADCGDSDTAAEISGLDGTQTPRTANRSSPALLHTVKNQRSILALVVSDSNIYAGTQGGELLVSNSQVMILLSRWTDWSNGRAGHSKLTSCSKLLPHTEAAYYAFSYRRMAAYSFPAPVMQS